MNGPDGTESNDGKAKTVRCARECCDCGGDVGHLMDAMLNDERSALSRQRVAVVVESIGDIAVAHPNERISTASQTCRETQRRTVDAISAIPSGDPVDNASIPGKDPDVADSTRSGLVAVADHRASRSSTNQIPHLLVGEAHRTGLVDHDHPSRGSETAIEDTSIGIGEKSLDPARVASDGGRSSSRSKSTGRSMNERQVDDHRTSELTP